MLHQDKKLRIKLLKKLDRKLLEKTLLLLSQLNRAGSGVHKIKENEIKGLKTEDITYILYEINPIYSNLPYYSDNELMVKEKRIIKRNKKVIEKHILYGDAINNPVFFQCELDTSSDKYAERTFMVGQHFELALNEIGDLLSNKKLVNPNKIKGLKKPFHWENITIIHTGQSLKVKQNDALLGEYMLTDLGIPKLRKTNKVKGVQPFLLSLFFSGEKLENDLLLSTNTLNQKTKSNLSKILKDIFDTNEDPIKIDETTKNYTAVFRTSTGGSLAINNHSSGSKFYDTSTDFNSAD